MSIAAIVPFYKYCPDDGQAHRHLFEYWLKSLDIWKEEVDKIYFVDSGCGYLDSDYLRIKSRVDTAVFRRPLDSHWSNLNLTIPFVSEDKFVILDSDMFIYRKGVITEIEKQLDNNYDIVSLLDTSGGIALEDKYPYLKANSFRSIRRRFAPYLFAVNTEYFKSIGHIDFTPLGGDQWTDSMGLITDQLLSKNPRLFELDDDRSTLNFKMEGDFYATSFLDSTEYEWSKNPHKDYGFYHARGWGGGHGMIENRRWNQAAYWPSQKAMPLQEGMRLLAWQHVMSDEQYHRAIYDCCLDFGVSEARFNEYVTEFKKFHSWTKGFE